MTAKRVDYTIDTTGVIRPCCDRATGLEAARGFRIDTQEAGMILHSPSCDCPDRWLRHDWHQHGLPVFEQHKAVR
jgi:hypothetical protein